MTRLNDHLNAHRQALLGCRRCGHADGIAPIVSLARSPRVMLVGQAPGRVESDGGRPFAGRAGRTLWSWLETVGLDEGTLRSRMYIAAVTRCYPGPSPSGRGDRVPDQEERAQCAGWLAAELRLIRPRLIVPVGRLAIELFLEQRPLDELVGREHRIDPANRRLPAFVRETVAGDTAIVPLPHPSGASSWVHVAGNRRLLNGALALIARHWRAVHSRSKVA